MLRLGFLDGIPGLHVCAYTAFYVFMKQARLWELHHAKHQPDPEAQDHSGSEGTVPLRFPAPVTGQSEHKRAA